MCVINLCLMLLIIVLHIQTLNYCMKFSIAPIQVVFKRNNKYFVAFFDAIITLLYLPLKLSSKTLRFLKEHFKG